MFINAATKKDFFRDFSRNHFFIKFSIGSADSNKSYQLTLKGYVIAPQPENIFTAQHLIHRVLSGITNLILVSLQMKA